MQFWTTRVFNSDNEDSLFTQSNIHARAYKSWVYADRSFEDPTDSGQELWGYSRGQDLMTNYILDGWPEFRNCWVAFGGLNYNSGNTSLYNTRWLPDYSARGPLMSIPWQDLSVFLQKSPIITTGGTRPPVVPACFPKVRIALSVNP
jgi:hypothetical protein